MSPPRGPEGLSWTQVQRTPTDRRLRRLAGGAHMAAGGGRTPTREPGACLLHPRAVTGSMPPSVWHRRGQQAQELSAPRSVSSVPQFPHLQSRGSHGSLQGPHEN